MEYILNKIQEKFPKQVDPMLKKSTRLKRVFAVRTDKDRTALFNEIKTFLKSTKDEKGRQYTVTERMEIAISKSVPLLVVKEDNIEYAFVAKPYFSTRASSGSVTQQKMKDFIENDLGLKVTSVAGLSQRTQDITFSINGVSEGMEIKGSGNYKQKVATFDRSVARSGVGLSTRTDDTPIQEVVRALMEEHNVSVEGSNNNLTQYIDFLRTKDKTIGFYGDEGVTALGGKITDQYFTSTNSQSIKKISDVVKKHFAQNKDNYYVLYDNPSNNFVIMTTGYGTSNLKSLPIGSKIASFDDSSISSAGIGLYGTLGQKGRIRLAIYFKFNTTVITQSSIKNDF